MCYFLLCVARKKCGHFYLSCTVLSTRPNDFFAFNYFVYDFTSCTKQVNIVPNFLGLFAKFIFCVSMNVVPKKCISKNICQLNFEPTYSFNMICCAMNCIQRFFPLIFLFCSFRLKFIKDQLQFASMLLHMFTASFPWYTRPSKVWHAVKHF